MKIKKKDLIDNSLQQNDKKEKLFKRKFGAAKGMFWMADDFNEPLDDMKDYMY